MNAENINAWKNFPAGEVMDITALQNNGIMSLENTNSLNYTQSSYTKNDESETSSSSDSVSISEQARLLFAQSYGQYNGLTASMQSSDSSDSLLQSLAQSYTASGKADESAASQLAADSAVATEQAQSAAPAPAEGGQGGSGGQGSSEEDDSAEQENIRQQISALQSRVSMLSATLASGDTTAYGQLASLEAQISSLTASLRA